jgi:hypothetical protein
MQQAGIFAIFVKVRPFKLLVTALCRITAPISPRQQCHLAFISEFIVQMLYLPSLKNVVVNFLSHPPPPPPPSPPRQRQIQLTLKPWPPSKTAVQKRSVCSEVHPSNLLSDKQVLNAWLATWLREFFVSLSQQNSEKTFFAIEKHFPPWEAGLSAPCVF